MQVAARKSYPIDLSLLDGRDVDPQILSRLRRITRLKGFRGLAALPDLGISNHETPYSVVTMFEKFVTPQLITRNVSCGMCVLKLDVSPDELEQYGEQLIVNLHRRLRSQGIQTDWDRLERIYQEGPAAVYNAFPGLEQACTHVKTDSHSLAPLLAEPAPLSDIVPRHLLKSKKRMWIPGQRIFKNHFVEFGRLHPLSCCSALTKTTAEIKLLNESSTYCSFHLESSFTGSAHRVFFGSRRKERRTGSIWSKPWMKTHLNNIQFNIDTDGKLQALNVLRRLARHKDFVSIPIDSKQGQRYLSAVQMLLNYESAVRLALAYVIAESVHETIGRECVWSIVFEHGHNTFHTEHVDGKPMLVSRTDCVKADTGPIGYIAGMYDIPSILLRPRYNGFRFPWCNTYDHGIGNNLWRETGEWHYEGEGVQDVSQYESKYRETRSESVAVDSRREVVGQCTTCRAANPQTDDFVEVQTWPVYVGDALRYLLKKYLDAQSPVEPIALIHPMINYKVRSKK